MGIDLHAFNFLRLHAESGSLGDVLTIGRQSLSVSEDQIKKHLGLAVKSADGYCEPLLIALGARSVSSVDFSDYEGATYIADLNDSVDLGRKFDSVIDSGSLEHIFDVAAAFRNCIRFCKVGGRIIHILPVNNLGGHGFWQFTSDLIYSVYSKGNGFKNTKVYYASGIEFSDWFEVPEAKPGARVEVASVEPIILLSVTEKYDEVECIKVIQPFYQNAWDDGDVSKVVSGSPSGLLMKASKKFLVDRGVFVNFIRNTLFVLRLLIGNNRFSVRQHRRVSAFQPNIRGRKS